MVLGDKKWWMLAPQRHDNDWLQIVGWQRLWEVGFTYSIYLPQSNLTLIQSSVLYFGRILSCLYLSIHDDICVSISLSQSLSIHLSQAPSPLCWFLSACELQEAVAHFLSLVRCVSHLTFSWQCFCWRKVFSHDKPICMGSLSLKAIADSSAHPFIKHRWPVLFEMLNNSAVDWQQHGLAQLGLAD